MTVIFFLEIDFAAMLSYAYASVIVIISLKWAARICGLLKWATARKRLRNTGLEQDLDRCDGVVARASASQSVDLGFIPLVESYQKTLKNGIRSFPAWRSAFRGGCGEQAGKFACCVLGQSSALNGMPRLCVEDR